MEILCQRPFYRNLRRTISIRLIELLIDIDKLIKNSLGHLLFLFGPRSTGKSTWVQTEFPSALLIDLLKASTFTRLTAQPDRLERIIPAGFSDWVIIDEIQKIPALLDEVHRLIRV